jgi:hypothetical protein
MRESDTRGAQRDTRRLSLIASGTHPAPRMDAQIGRYVAGRSADEGPGVVDAVFEHLVGKLRI